MEQQLKDQATDNSDSSETAILERARRLRLSLQVTASNDEQITEPAPPSAIKGPDAAKEHLDLRLRQLISTQAPWLELKPLVWRRYAQQVTPTAAAQAFELACLYAPAEELQAWAWQLEQECPEFYRNVHHGVREELAKQDIVTPWLASMLLKYRHQTYLTAAERLMVLLELCRKKDQEEAIHYFRTYEPDLRQAIVHGKSNKHPDACYLMIGKAALAFGYLDLGRELLYKVTDETHEKDEALQLLMQASQQSYGVHEGYWRDELLNEPNIDIRLQKLQNIFSEIRDRSAALYFARTAINDLLRDPSHLIGSQAKHLKQLSLIIMSHRELRDVLPNLFQIFQDAQREFTHRDHELALWSPLSAITPIDSWDLYWCGVAKLHLYISATPCDESLLWEARSLVLQAKSLSRQNLPSEWRDLQKAAYQWVVKTPRLLEVDRDIMLCELRVAVEIQNLATTDLEDYLAKKRRPALIACHHLTEATRLKRLPRLEAAFMLQAATVSHLTNTQLKRIYAIAADANEDDLAWRTLTVLKARAVLPITASHAWDISGEKRSHYGFTAPTQSAIAICAAGLSPEVQRLAEALVVLSGKLTELFSLLDPGVTKGRWQVYPRDTLEYEVDQALSNISWLHKAKKRYIFSFESMHSHTQIPGFMQVLPNNAWSITVARLCEYLGVNAFGFKLARLSEEVSDVFPRVAGRQDLKSQSGHLGSWLRSLSAEQRRAWLDLQSTLKTMSLDFITPADELAAFICRLATLIHGAHASALSSLEIMRAPIAVRWYLESWLISPPYSQFRREHSLATRVQIPRALKNLF